MKYFNIFLDWIHAIYGWITSYVETLPRLELALQILVFTVVILFVITLLIAVGVVFLRFKNNIRSNRYHRLENKWENIIMGFLLSDDDPDPQLLRINNRERLFFVQYLYRFASRLRGAELKTIKTLAIPHLSKLSKKLAKGYPELRARNINILATLGFPEFLEPIKAALYDKSPIVKMAAARTLAHKEYPEHIDIILPVLSSFDFWSMNFLASMLAEMGPEAAPRLRQELLNHETSVRARIASAEALRKIGDLSSADTAIKVLEFDNDPELCAACLKIIRDMGTPRHRPLLHSLVSSPAEIIRIHAMAALGSVGGAEDNNVFKQAFDDSSTWVAYQAARSLSQIGSSSVLTELAESEHPRAAIAHQVLAEAVSS